MKHNLILFLLACSMLFGIIVPQGCSYGTIDITPPPVDTTVKVSFSMEIVPIFNASCNIQGCHRPGAIRPDLSPENAYDALWNGGYIDTLTPEQSELYLWTNGTRKPPMPLSGVDPNIYTPILTWITQGAENN